MVIGISIFNMRRILHTCLQYKMVNTIKNQVQDHNNNYFKYIKIHTIL